MLVVKFNNNDSSQNPSAYALLEAAHVRDNESHSYDVFTEHVTDGFTVCYFGTNLTPRLQHVMEADVSVAEWWEDQL